MFRRYQALKLKAMSTIHRSMTANKSFEAERQTRGPLTLLACMNWYIRVLFSSASPQRSNNKIYFNAICGMEEFHINPYDTGEVTFTMANVWSVGNKCPSMKDAVLFSLPEIYQHFKVYDTRTLGNLVSNKDRSHPASLQRNRRPGFEVLLLHVSRTSYPLTGELSTSHEEALFGELHELGRMNADEIVEAIFVAMTRAIWCLLPSQKTDGKHIPNIRIQSNFKESQEQWGAKEFRQSPDQLSQCFKVSQILATKAGQDPKERWNKHFEKIFGSMASLWNEDSVPKGFKSLGYYPNWKVTMELLREKPPLQRAAYRVMRAKFDTMLAFPQLKANGDWITARGEAGHAVKIMQNPIYSNLGSNMLHEAGYIVTPSAVGP
jgi:hypothetical protein